MSLARETHDDLSQPKPSKSAEHQVGGGYEFYALKEDADKVEKGNASASEALLRETLNIKNGGHLKDVAQDLEKSGNAKITYGPNGDVEHIVFNGSNGKDTVDIDLQHESINGKSAPQIREAEVKQAKEYAAAVLADPKMTDASGKPLSPEARVAAKALLGALLDGDSEALTKVAQQIMKSPDMAKSIEYALNQIQIPSSISFGKYPDGKPYMKADATESVAVIVPGAGRAYATSLDAYGDPTNKGLPSLDPTNERGQ